MTENKPNPLDFCPLCGEKMKRCDFDYWCKHCQKAFV